MIRYLSWRSDFSVFKGKMDKLFDSYIQYLSEHSVYSQIVEFLAEQKSGVIDTATRMVLEEGEVPFLPVIPRKFWADSSCRKPFEPMRLAKSAQKDGVFGGSMYVMGPGTAVDLMDVPENPYFVFGVEDGSSTNNLYCREAAQVIEWRQMSPLTLAELIALCAHTDVLSRMRFLIPLGSRSHSANGGIFEIQTHYENGRPLLERYEAELRYIKRGFPSCRGRLSFSDKPLLWEWEPSCR